MDERCIELTSKKCSVRRPLESIELLQQYGFCWRACGTLKSYGNSMVTAGGHVIH
jgi:hypothetical protein